MAALSCLALFIRGPELWQQIEDNEALNPATASVAVALFACGIASVAVWAYARIYATTREGKDAAIPLWVSVVLILFLFFYTSGIGVLAAWIVLDGPAVDIPETLGAGQAEKLLVRIFSLSAVLSAVVILVTTYRKQLGTEAEGREQVKHFADLFSTAVGQLSAEHPTVRLAGAQHLALLADSAPSEKYKQNCVDQLCSYLRTPHRDLAEWDGDSSPPRTGRAQDGSDRIQIRAAHEVNLTIIRLIRNHCRPKASETDSWSNLDFDMTGAVFHQADFSDSVFRGRVVFREAHFASGRTSFDRVRFEHETEEGLSADFSHAVFSCTESIFQSMVTAGGIDFSGARFVSGRHSLDRIAAESTGRNMSYLNGVKIEGGSVDFELPAGREVDLWLDGMEITGGEFFLTGKDTDPTDKRVNEGELTVKDGGALRSKGILIGGDSATVVLSPEAPVWLKKAVAQNPDGTWIPHGPANDRTNER
ncbi:hypothetical protein GCM10023405_21220 [Streptomonospora salina]